MKKLWAFLLFASLFLGLSNSSVAQENYGNALNGFVKFGENFAVSGHYEFQVANNITVSPAATIAFGDDSWIGLGGRADYYFDSLFKLNEPWDIWGGVDAGFLVNYDSGDDFSVNIHAGVEYKFSEMWGIIAEFGGGTNSSGGIGVGIHF